MVITTQTYRAPPQSVWPHVTTTMRALGWRVKTENPSGGTIVATVRMSFWSYGEKVTVRVYVQPDGLTAVAAEARARWGYTWGKTQEDIDKFFAALHSSILAAMWTLANPLPPQS